MLGKVEEGHQECNGMDAAYRQHQNNGLGGDQMDQPNCECGPGEVRESAVVETVSLKSSYLTRNEFVIIAIT